jgi:hypothetical protein
MAATPKRLVHWAVEYSKSPIGSPQSDTSSTQGDSTSTLQYVNAQLCAHGFATSPGLSLDGLPNAASEKVVKCLFAMLGQRIVRGTFSPLGRILSSYAGRHEPDGGAND